VVNVLLFDDFTTLDALGPVEVLSRLKDNTGVTYASVSGGLVRGTGNAQIATVPLSEVKTFGIVLVPGGMGTRKLADDETFLGQLRSLCEKSEFVLSVCTGSALLAKAGVLEDRKATSNKMAWDWVIRQSRRVDWVRKARWVVDGKFYTSSGVTAGIDMALGFVSDRSGQDYAQKIASGLEYLWNSDRDTDPFAGV
jgi:putative intracellular protease/amidase